MTLNEINKLKEIQRNLPEKQMLFIQIDNDKIKVHIIETKISPEYEPLKPDEIIKLEDKTETIDGVEFLTTKQLIRNI